VDTYRSAAQAALATVRIPKLGRELAAYLTANDIDIVLSTAPHPWTPMLLGRVRSHGRKLVQIIHDAQPHPGEAYPLPKWFLSTVIRRSDGIVVLSEHVRRQLLDNYRYPADRVWVIPHGRLPYPGGEIKERRTSDRPFRVMFFGRVLAYKGVGLLLDAYEAIAHRHDISLAIVGSGDLSPWRTQIARLPRVELDNRWIGTEEIGPILSRADLIVLPYLEATQSGVAAAAYAAGIPVVATPVGGLVEQIRHSETGLIAEKVDPKSLADAILRLADDRSLYERCAAGARAIAANELGWATIGRRMAEVIENVRDLPRID
jgi:glycosyltransferase involved in cell wall biosynthesis